MLDIGTSFLIQFTDTALHKCAVCSATLRGNVDGLLTAELWEKDDDIEPGQEFLAYYDIDGKYVKHSASIEMILPSDTGSMISFRLIDQPISAENREDERITIKDMQLIANFDDETDYPIIDVSNYGFAIESTKKYTIANVVAVTIRFHGTKYIGKASIESITELSTGHYRYGLRCVDNSRTSVSLKAALQNIKSAFDNTQDLPATGSY